MPFLGHNPSYIKGILEFTLPDPPRALLCLPSFRSFFSLFTPSSPGYTPGNITILNTPSARSVVSSPFTPTPNCRIRQAIACLNRQEKYKE